MDRTWINIGTHKILVADEAKSADDRSITMWDLELIADEADRLAREHFEEDQGYPPDEDCDLRVVTIPMKLRKSRRGASTYITFKVLVSWES